jgi:hypothetical protein
MSSLLNGAVHKSLIQRYPDLRGFCSDWAPLPLRYEFSEGDITPGEGLKELLRRGAQSLVTASFPPPKATRDRLRRQSVENCNCRSSDSLSASVAVPTLSREGEMAIRKQKLAKENGPTLFPRAFGRAARSPGRALRIMPASELCRIHPYRQ